MILILKGYINFDLGVTKKSKATPIIHDIDSDGMNEGIVAYDTDSEMVLDVWSPRMTCSEEWSQATGHTTEQMWSWKDEERR